MNYWKLLYGSILLSAGCEPEWNQADDNVVRLLSETQKGIATGSAFAINERGDYVTNHHVIEGAQGGSSLYAVESVSPNKILHPATAPHPPDVSTAVI